MRAATPHVDHGDGFPCIRGEIQVIVDQIKLLESSIKGLSDDDLCLKTKTVQESKALKEILTDGNFIFDDLNVPSHFNGEKYEE